MAKIHAIALFPGIIAIGIAIAGCSYIEQRRAAQKCRFEIDRIEVAGFSLSDMSLDLRVNVTNPGRQDAVIDRMDLDLFIENKKTVNVIFDGVTVPPGATRAMKAVMSVPFSTIGMSISNPAGSDTGVRYRLAGTAFLKTPAGVFKLPVTITKN